MNSEPIELTLSRVAGAMSVPARVRMLCCLLDGRARTSTELSVTAGVSPPTASVHLSRLRSDGLVKAFAQGKHRYYSLEGSPIAKALEALLVVAGGSPEVFVPKTPSRLRAVRICYDHLAGELAVSWRDRLERMRWLAPDATLPDAYDVTRRGTTELERLGLDVGEARASRRRFAYACVDWSERRPHIGGALGAALRTLALRRKWIVGDLDSRIVTVTRVGRREFQARFGIDQPPGKD